MTNPETDLERELRRTLYQADGDALAVPDMVERVGAGMARTRRRRGTIAAVLASAVLVVGVSVVSANTGPSRSVDAAETDRTNTPPFPAPPEGTAWIGMNGVVVAVPADWPVSELPCGTGARGEVIDARRGDGLDCSFASSSVETQVRFTTFAQAPQPPSTERVCEDSFDGFCEGLASFEAQDVGISVIGRGTTGVEQVRRILASAMVLPEGWTTVPFGEGATVEGRIGKLEAAGFEVDVTDAERIDRFAISVTPAVGTPVEEGSLIELAPLITDPPTEGVYVPGCRQVQVGTSTSATAEELTVLLENGGNTPCDLSGVRVAVTLGDLELGDRAQPDDFASQDTDLPAGATAVLSIATNPGCQFSNQVFDINLDDGTSLTVIHPGEIGGDCIRPGPTMQLTAVEVLGARGQQVPADGGSGGTSSVGLPCSPEQQVGTDLDYSGPGRPTPAEAVAPFADGSVLFTTQVGARQAEVRSQDADGVTVRVFRTNKLSDGWWPAGYLECADDAVAPSATDLDGTWEVQALVGRDAQSLLVGQNSDALTMTFDDGEMSGSSGCNSVFGTYVQSGPNDEDLTFPSNGLGSSAVGCTEPPLLERLQDVRHVSGEGDTRRLHAANWMIIVDLRRAQ